MVEVEIIDVYPKKSKKGLDFHYVREGDKLYHISRYAKGVKKESNEIKYVIEFEHIAGKFIYCFDRSNSGYPGFWKYRVTSSSKQEWELQEVDEKELAKLKLGDYSPNFQLYIRENWEHMLKMREEIRDSKLWKTTNYFTVHPGTECFLRSPILGYWDSACWPNDRSRANSISQVMKYLHQVWCLTILTEMMGINKLISGVTIEQGSGWPSLVFKDSKGQIWSAWVEAQWIEGFEPGEWLRADIIFAKGDWRGKLAPYNVKGVETEILIECKHEEWSRWWNEKTEKQLNKYMQTFKPRVALLVSLRKVPEWLKQRAREIGYVVFDQVYPCSEKVKDLLAFISTF